MRRWFLIGLALLFGKNLVAESPRLDADGVLVLEGQRRFMIGCYYNPMTAAGLEELARNGFNLVHCSAKTEALDLTRAAGLYAWINTGSLIDFSQDTKSRTEKLTQLVRTFQNHPALAVWEAPDEALWNLSYPTLSRLFYSDTVTVADQDQILEKQKQAVIQTAAGFADGVAHLKSLDRRPIWFNHAPRNSLADLKLFSKPADMLGCDIYPVHEGLNGHSDFVNHSLSSVGEYTDYMQSAAPGKPVWMVLQAFSWDLLKNPVPEQPEPRTFPTYRQSRFMAYNAILHGAQGILYWGSHYTSPQSRFWKSLLAVTREIAALEPFLVAPEIRGKMKVEPIQFTSSQPTRVASTVRQVGNEYLLIVMQEDLNQPVTISNLRFLENRTFYELGTSREYVVRNGQIRIWHSLEPHVLCTTRKFEVKPEKFPEKWDDTDHPLHTVGE